MTRHYTEAGEAVAVTKVAAGPCVITQIKNVKKDGYQAVQVGFGQTKASRLAKPQVGHLKKIEPLKKIREFRLDGEVSFKVGDKFNCSTFTAGDRVDVTGTSKGKGFAGVVKRHGFHGSPASHGHKDQLRMPGSIGASATPSRVHKGKRMGGHMGDDQVTIKNLKVVDVDTEAGFLYLAGAIPGARNGFLSIKGEGEMSLAQDKPEVKKESEKETEVKSEVKVETTPEAKAEVKSEEKSEAKPEAKVIEKKEEPKS